MSNEQIAITILFFVVVGLILIVRTLVLRLEKLNNAMISFYEEHNRDMLKAEWRLLKLEEKE